MLRSLSSVFRRSLFLGWVALFKPPELLLGITLVDLADLLVDELVWDLLIEVDGGSIIDSLITFGKD